MDRSGNPTDAGEAFRRKMGRDPYPSPVELREWERIHKRSYYNDDPIVDPAPRRQEPIVDPTPRRQERSLVPLPPPTRTFEELMEDKIAPSVIMLALNINGVLADELSRDAILEWVNARLKRALYI